MKRILIYNLDRFYFSGGWSKYNCCKFYSNFNSNIYVKNPSVSAQRMNTTDGPKITSNFNSKQHMRFIHLKFVSPCIIIQFKHSNQLDATTSQVYYLTFMYSSTCFGRSHAHHQELNNCSSSLWFYRWRVVVVVLLVVVGPVGRPRPTALLSPSSDSKPVAATAVVELLMMDVRTPETCWAVHKRQVIHLRSCCI